MNPNLHHTAVALVAALLLGACDSNPVDAVSGKSEDTQVSSQEHADLSKAGDKTPLCHFNGDDATYYRLDVGPNALDSHLTHGDLLYNPDVTDSDPSDGDLHCISRPESNALVERITFASDRDGHFHIYAMDADGSNETQLTFGDSTGHDPVFSPDGTKIAFYSILGGLAEIYVMDADGSNLTLVTDDACCEEYSPAWSPDGTRLAFVSEQDGNAEIYAMDIDGSNEVRLTDSFGLDREPTYSPDGTKIVFTSQRDGNDEIYVMNAVDGSNVQRLTFDTNVDIHAAWSPDGSKIAFTSTRDSGGGDIYVMNADGTGQTARTSDGFSRRPAWSPDGSKIVFESRRTGSDELFVMNADGSNPVRLTFNDDEERNPSWSVASLSP